MNMTNAKALHKAIFERLSMVIDPETGVDVVRMRLIEDLIVNKDGHVSYTFRPSSAFCPMAVPLADAIQRAVAEVPGVIAQDVKVIGFALSDELMALLRQALEDRQNNSKEQTGERKKKTNSIAKEQSE
jgi:metal-sulfur cluster biosynthetic enzyme